MEYVIRICNQCGLFGAFATQNICPACSGEIVDTELTLVQYANLSDQEKNSYRIHFLGKIPDDELIYKRVQYEKQVHKNIEQIGAEHVECPYCHSHNTKKITNTSKTINTALFGIFGTKRHKQWHCNNCSSDF